MLHALVVNKDGTGSRAGDEIRLSAPTVSAALNRVTLIPRKRGDEPPQHTVGVVVAPDESELWAVCERPDVVVRRIWQTE